MWIVTIATIYLVHGTAFALPGGNKVTSTNFPSTYPSNEDTEQTLSVQEGYNMLITFQEFQLQTHGSCAYDYVQICDDNNLCGKKLCGTSLPDPITVTTSTATVVFHSDGSVSRKGFSLTYKKIRPEVAAFSIGGGPSALEGNVFYGGRPICDDQWDTTDAGVFCRMMGYQNGNATHWSTCGQVSADFSMGDVQCNGHETNLIDCNHTTRHNCGSSEVAGVICSGGSAFSISGGPSALEGNIFYGGRPICDGHWDNTDAAVFCRMMGYQNGNATYRSTYGQVMSDFSMDDVQCNGHETNLLDCHHTTRHNCGSSEGAGVICSVPTGPLSGPVYILAGGMRDDGSSLHDISVYHPSVNKVDCSISPPLLNNDWYYHTTFYHDQTVYLCGGWNTGSICISHKTGTKGWKTHTLTISRKSGPSSVVLNNRLYIIGGDQDGGSNYALSTSLPLTYRPALTKERNLDYIGKDPCAAKLDQNTLVVTGGYKWEDTYGTVATYNVKTSTYTHLPYLHNERFSHGCVVVEKDNTKWIIVAGGYWANEDYGFTLHSTEILQLGGTNWIQLGNLNVARRGHSMVVTQRGVIVIGGEDNNDNKLTSVELLDWNSKTWSVVQPSLKKGRNYFGGAVEIPASMFNCTG